MTCAPAITYLFVAHGNLSAAVDHYEMRDDLCLTETTTLGASGSLSTTGDPTFNLKVAGNSFSLRSTGWPPLRPGSDPSDHSRACQKANQSALWLVPSPLTRYQPLADCYRAL